MSYLLTLFVLFLTLFNTGYTQEYNCTKCYNEIKQNGFYDLCSKVIKNRCSDYNLENSSSGIILCGYIMREPCY